MATKCSHVIHDIIIAERRDSWHCCAMYIESVPNRNSPPAILLRESYRDGGKIKKRTIANLSDWQSEIVEGLRTLLKGGKVAPAGQEPSWCAARCRMAMSRPYSARCATSLSIVCSGRLATVVVTSSSR